MAVEIRELVLRARIVGDEPIHDEAPLVGATNVANEERRRAELVALIDARIRASLRRGSDR